MIFKLQRALTSSEEAPPCLLYNEDQSIVEQVYIPEEDYLGIFGTKYKVYVEGIYENSQFTLIDKVEDQDW